MEMLICFFVAFSGVFMHCCIKANSLMTDAKRLKVDFTVKDYLSKDFIGICLSISVIFVWLFIFPEVANVRPNLLNFVRLSFFAIGLFGSVIIQAIFNKGKAYIRSKIEDTVSEKENLQYFADGPPLTNPEGDPNPPSGPKGGSTKP